MNHPEEVKAIMERRFLGESQEAELVTESLIQVERTPRPRIMYKLTRKDSTRIACHCGRPARYGHSADGGAPYVYDCSKHVPMGVPIQMCVNTAEVVAAVEERNEILLSSLPARKRAEVEAWA